MNLLLLIGAPLLTAVAVLFSRNKQQVNGSHWLAQSYNWDWPSLCCLPSIKKGKPATQPRCYLNRTTNYLLP